MSEADVRDCLINYHLNTEKLYQILKNVEKSRMYWQENCTATRTLGVKEIACEIPRVLSQQEQLTSLSPHSLSQLSPQSIKDKPLLGKSYAWIHVQLFPKWNHWHCLCFINTITILLIKHAISGLDKIEV